MAICSSIAEPVFVFQFPEIDVLLKQSPTRKGQSVSHTSKESAELQNCRSLVHCYIAYQNSLEQLKGLSVGPRVTCHLWCPVLPTKVNLRIIHPTDKKYTSSETHKTSKVKQIKATKQALTNKKWNKSLCFIRLQWNKTRKQHQKKSQKLHNYMANEHFWMNTGPLKQSQRKLKTS